MNVIAYLAFSVNNNGNRFELWFGNVSPAVAARCEIDSRSQPQFSLIGKLTAHTKGGKARLALSVSPITRHNRSRFSALEAENILNAG